MITKFIHLRAYNNDKVLSLGGITIAYITNNTDIIFNFCKCRNDERYCKATGRQIASDRLDKNPITIDSSFITDFVVNTNIFKSAYINEFTLEKFSTKFIEDIILSIMRT